MDKERKCISFEAKKNELIEKELDNCIYRGSITICISGTTSEDAQYEIYTEFFTEEEAFEYLANAYMIIISEKEIKETVINYELVLNTCTTIYFYCPINKNINKLYFQYDIETGDEVLEQVIASTIIQFAD